MYELEYYYIHRPDVKFKISAHDISGVHQLLRAFESLKIVVVGIEQLTPEVLIERRDRA